MNSAIVTGAVGRPRVVPLCGMPLNSALTFEARGRASLSDPTAGTLPSEFDDPPPSTTAKTIATPIATTTAPAAISTRGDAWRCRGAPFGRTGGGAAGAVRPALARFTARHRHVTVAPASSRPDRRES